MKPRRLVNNELLASIDVLNTIYGGVSQHQLSLMQFPDHREIRLKVPGVKEENMKTEIDDNVLSVVYTFQIESNGIWIEIPKEVYKKPIPYFVDVDKITASFENDLLTVTLPYNSLAEGYHRSVSIEK